MAAKAKLSKNLLEMKFMKRSKVQAGKEAETESLKAYFEGDLLESMKKEGSKYVIEPSVVFCEKLLPGRRSYKGMNPEIEKLMSEDKQLVKVAKESEGISDYEMANRYSTLVDTISRKFNKRTSESNSQNLRKHFKKPKYDDD